MTRAVVSLGSNLGDRLATLNGAVDRIADLGTIHALSRLYETAPVGGPDQEPFYNAVAVVETSLDLHELLAALHRIEAEFDRTREVRWGPRTLDLDLIMHGATSITSQSITVPHPRYRERRFVVEPLLDAWPDAHHPDGTALAPALADLVDQELSVVEGTSWRGDAGVERHGDRARPGNRGEWVAGQMVVIAGFLASVVLTADASTVASIKAVGGFVVLVGVVILSAAMSDLGRFSVGTPWPLKGGLVASGVYGTVRHPMYTAVMVITLGLAGLFGSWLGLALWPIVVLFFWAKTRSDETWLAASYPTYRAYREAVSGRFVPRRR